MKLNSRARLQLRMAGSNDQLDRNVLERITAPLVPLALHPSESMAKAVPHATITGHPVYSSGCPEMLRW